MATRKMGMGLKALFRCRKEEADKEADMYEAARTTLEDVQKTLQSMKEDGYDVAEAVDLFNQAVEPLKKNRFQEVIDIAERAKEVALLSSKVVEEKGGPPAAPAEEVPTLIMLDTAEADKSIFRTKRIVRELENAGCDVTQIVYLLYKSLEAYEEGNLRMMKKYAKEAESYSQYVIEMEFGHDNGNGNGNAVSNGLC